MIRCEKQGKTVFDIAKNNAKLYQKLKAYQKIQQHLIQIKEDNEYLANEEVVDSTDFKETHSIEESQEEEFFDSEEDN